MSADRPTRLEVETLTAALERGWAPPLPVTAHLDLAVTVLASMSGEDQRPEPQYDQDGYLAGWHGIAPVRPQAPKRRDSVTRKHLEEVAEVYRQAVEDGAAPTMAVATRFNASHSTATRWVGMARHPRNPAVYPRRTLTR